MNTCYLAHVSSRVALVFVDTLWCQSGQWDTSGFSWSWSWSRSGCRTGLEAHHSFHWRTTLKLRPSENIPPSASRQPTNTDQLSCLHHRCHSNKGARILKAALCKEYFQNLFPSTVAVLICESEYSSLFLFCPSTWLVSQNQFPVFGVCMNVFIKCNGHSHHSWHRKFYVI